MSRPRIEDMNHCTLSKPERPVAAETSQSASRIVPNYSAPPVMRWTMDNVLDGIGRKICRWGERGRAMRRRSAAGFGSAMTIAFPVREGPDQDGGSRIQPNERTPLSLARVATHRNAIAY